VALEVVAAILAEEVPVEVGNPKPVAVPQKLARYLTAKDLETIRLAVDEAESRTSAEIRIHINFRLLFFETSRKRAARLFRQLGMHQTRDATGVLLFFTLKEQRFEIITDRGIDAKIDSREWTELASELPIVIHQKGLTEGICDGVRRLGDLLAVHFSRLQDDRNELSDDVSL